MPVLELPVSKNSLPAARKSHRRFTEGKTNYAESLQELELWVEPLWPIQMRDARRRTVIVAYPCEDGGDDGSPDTQTQ